MKSLIVIAGCAISVVAVGLIIAARNGAPSAAATVAPTLATSDSSPAVALRSELANGVDNAAGTSDDQPTTGRQQLPASKSAVGSDLTDEERWANQYALASVPQLRDEREALNKYVTSRTKDLFADRFARGQTVHVRDGNRVSVHDFDSSQLMEMSLSGPGGDGANKVVLSENEFPDLYQMKHQEDWLSAEILRRESLPHQ